MYGIKRSGFAMIMAIFMVVLIALGGIMILSNVSVAGKSAGDKYIKAQAELIADSAVEYALMRVQGFDMSTGNCLNQVTVNVNDASGVSAYTANVSLLYSFRNAAPTGGTCNFLAQNTGKDTSVLVDVTVTATSGMSTEDIRIHKRSWQKF